jgi:transposase
VALGSFRHDLRCSLDTTMRHPLPPIAESAGELKDLLTQERHPAKRSRLHALYLLASEQARTRQEVAALLGVDRNTVGRWLTAYAQGGVPALLTVYVPAGKRKPLTPDQLQTLQQALAQPTGVASFGAIRPWISDTFGVQISYNAMRNLVRYTLGAKLKGPRPAQQKKG